MTGAGLDVGDNDPSVHVQQPPSGVHATLRQHASSKSFTVFPITWEWIVPGHDTTPSLLNICGGACTHSCTRPLGELPLSTEADGWHISPRAAHDWNGKWQGGRWITAGGGEEP